MVVSYVAADGWIDEPSLWDNIVPGIQKSTNGGKTWHPLKSLPTDFYPNIQATIHASVAWGPGPTCGTYRLYYVNYVGDNAETDPDKYNGGGVGIFASDDEGDTWSLLRLEYPPNMLTGTVPDVTVDLDPRSPGYGNVYVAYNWALLTPIFGVPVYVNNQIRLLGSRDYGQTWSITSMDSLPYDFPPVPSGEHFIRKGFGKLATAHNGDLYVVTGQRPVTYSDPTHPSRFSGGDLFGAFQRMHLQPGSGFQKSPPVTMNSYSADAAFLNSPFRVYPGTNLSTLSLASMWIDVDRHGVISVVNEEFAFTDAPTARGTVHVGRSSDDGKSWKWTVLPAAPKFAGYRQSSTHPTIAVSPDGNNVFVGMRTLIDVPLDTPAPVAWYETDWWDTSTIPSPPTAGIVTLGNYFSTSSDGGRTFSTPQPVSDSRWNSETMTGWWNGVGLRDRARFVDNNTAVYVYGDGRNAGFWPVPYTDHTDFANSDVFAAFIKWGGN